MRMIRVKKNVIIFILIFIALNITPYITYLYAGIGVKPTITEIVVSPNAVTRGVFKVVNTERQKIHVKVEPEDWLRRRTGVSGIPIEEWLTITPMEFDIGPQGVKEVEYAISPPSGHEGELIAMVFFATSASGEGAFGITGRFGVSIYAAIEGTIILDCDINKINIKRNIKKREEGGIIDKGIIFILDIQNRGNVHLRPTGTIEVTDEYGARYEVEIRRGFPIYPGASLSYAVLWDKKSISPGRYEVNVKLDYGKIYNVDKTMEKKASFRLEDGEIVME